MNFYVSSKFKFLATLLKKKTLRRRKRRGKRRGRRKTNKVHISRSFYPAHWPPVLISLLHCYPYRSLCSLLEVCSCFRLAFQQSEPSVKPTALANFHCSPYSAEFGLDACCVPTHRYTCDSEDTLGQGHVSAQFCTRKSGSQEMAAHFLPRAAWAGPPGRITQGGL